MKIGSHRGSTLRWEWVALGAILLIAGATRFAYWREMAAEPALHAPFVDAQFHDYWAKGIATGEWSRPEGFQNPMIPDHPFAKPPGYAYFVATIYLIARPDYRIAVLVQMAMGLINIVLAWRIGRWLFGRVAGLIAAGTGGYWVLIYFEGELSDPTLTITLTLLLALAFRHWLTRPRWLTALAAGLILGILALVRSNILPLAPLMMLGMPLAGRGRLKLRRSAAHAALLALGTAAAIAPVTVRNYYAGSDGELVLIAANSGINLYMGNNPQVDLIVPTVPGLEEMLHRVGWSHFDDLAIVRAVEAKVGRRLGYGGVSKYFSAKAMEFVREHPGRALSLTAQRAVRMLGPAEYGNDMLALDREASPLLRRLPGNFTVVFVLAVAGFAQWAAAGRRRAPNKRRLTAWILAYLAVLYGTSIICFLEARYRTPMLPLLAMPAAFCLVRWARLAARRAVAPLAGWLVPCAGLYAALWWPSSDYQPNRAYWHYLRATQYAGIADTEHFAAELEKAYRLDPNNALIAFKFGRARLYQGRNEEAVRLFHRALEIKPDLFDAWFDLGSILYNAGRFEQAQEAFMHAARLNPRDHTVHGALEQAMNRRGLTPRQMQEVWDSLAN